MLKPKSVSSCFSRPARSHCSSTLFGGHEALDQVVDDLLADAGDGVADLLGFHQLGALAVDDAPLVVGDVVVLQQLLADVEVVRLDLALGALDLAAEEAALDDLAFLHADPREQRLGLLRLAEDAHQVVFHRQVEAAGAGVALAAGTAAQLVVDAPRLVALGADDVQARRRRPPAGGAAAIPRAPRPAWPRRRLRRRDRH
jgi:hypothetical protein